MWWSRAGKQPGFLAIRLEDNALSVVHGRAAAQGRAAVAHYASLKLAAGDAAGRALRDLHPENLECGTVLRGGEYQMLLVDAPNVQPAELKSAMRWRIKDMIDYHVDDATLDVLDIPAPGSGAGALNHQMYAVAARNDLIKSYITRFEAASIPLSVIDIPETAQRNIAALRETPERGAALLYCGEDASLITVSARGELYMARRFEVGLQQLRAAAPEARGEVLDRVAVELQRTLDHCERQFRQISVASVLLAPEPEETGLLEHLARSVALSVERVDLAELIEFGAGRAPDAATQWRLFHLFGASLRREAKAL